MSDVVRSQIFHFSLHFWNIEISIHRKTSRRSFRRNIPGIFLRLWISLFSRLTESPRTKMAVNKIRGAFCPAFPDEFE